MNRAVRFTVVMDLLMRLQHDGRLSSYSTTYISSKAVFDVTPNGSGGRNYRFTTMEAYAFALGVLSQ